MFLVASQKGKVVPVLNQLSSLQSRRMGEWRFSYNILDIGTRRRSVARFTPLPLYPPGKGPGMHWTEGCKGHTATADVKSKMDKMLSL
jgi:hypothetical protein